jgi:predicted transcriptional regulator
MNLAARKYNFIKELTTIDETLFEKLEIILRTSKKDWFTDLNSEEKLEIEIGLKQAENDEFISHETVMNQFAKWH